MMRQRVLFVLKQRESEWGGYTCSLSSGLLNSVTFITDMLTSFGVDAKLIEVQDNNDIDGAVTAWRPTHVVIEAFWVVPEKFDVLKPLHPDVHWIVRNHSEVPFLANEGIAFGWSAGYVRRGVELMCNAPRAVTDLRAVIKACGLNERLVSYGPNHYPIAEAGPLAPHLKSDDGALDIGCFGAVRPLKNHMLQAIAAVTFARSLRRPLRFHVNTSRVEGGGDPIVKNLQQFFDDCREAELVEHGWLPHSAFRVLLGEMDIALQVSFSETFNIVAADAAAGNVPVVVSREVPWLGAYAHADPTSAESIVRAMERVFSSDLRARLAQQRRDLATYCRHTEAAWLSRFSPSAPAYA